MAHSAPVIPVTTYELRIKGMTMDNYVGPGHQIRLEVAGFNFALAGLNWRTDGRNANAVDGLIVDITVYHGPDPSHALSVTATRWVPSGPTLPRAGLKRPHPLSPGGNRETFPTR